MSFQKNLTAVVKALVIAFGLTLLILFIVFGSVFLMWMNYSYNEYDWYSEICIDENKEIKNFACSGSGRSSNPYIIDNIEFSGSYWVGLRINSITKHVIIRNIQFRADEIGLSIGLLDSGSITVDNCTFMNCDLELMRCDSITITNDKFCENNLGIMIVSSTNLLITSNSFDSGGIHIEDSFRYGKTKILSLEDNYLQGKEILYLNNEENLLITTRYSQVIMFNCYNVKIENQEIMFAYPAFYIVDSENCIVKNSLAKYCYGGCRIINSDNITIINSTFIDLIYIEGDYMYLETGYGIDVKNSNYFILRNSTIYESYLDAVHLFFSDNSTIEYNNITQSHGSGLFLYEASSCIIMYNHFENNVEYGVDLTFRTYNCYVHHNNFINNSANPDYTEAYDSSASNYWYLLSVLEGNYWSNLGNSTTYLINTYNDIYDLYPFSEPIDIFG